MCVAFEYTPGSQPRCELHWDEIDRAFNNEESRKVGTECYIKLP